MDNLQSSLDSYYLQLQQAEAALTSDPTNAELLQLKHDLTEVINLTKELMVQHQGLDEPMEDDPNAKDWNVGDKCLAPWSGDGKLYEAVVEEILGDGKVSVGFTAYANGEVVPAAKLKPASGATGKSRLSDGPSGSSAFKRAGKETLAEKKQQLLKQKEYLKKRKQKKQARIQEQEVEREKDKKKWLNFTAKKGFVAKKKKSIFASPDTVDGRVGIGTCGVSGKPMTEYSAAEKWRKGWK